MINNSVFEDLKFGDKLATVTDNGKIEFFTYLSRDPGWQDRYCFLMLSSALLYNYKGKRRETLNIE